MVEPNSELRRLFEKLREVWWNSSLILTTLYLIAEEAANDAYKIGVQEGYKKCDAERQQQEELPFDLPKQGEEGIWL